MTDFNLSTASDPPGDTPQSAPRGSDHLPPADHGPGNINRVLAALVVIGTVLGLLFFFRPGPAAPSATDTPTAAPLKPSATPISLTAPATATLQPPEPASAGESIFPKITAADWQRGPAKARVTILEYGDYQ